MGKKKHNYKHLLILALHQGFIDQKLCTACVKTAKKADDGYKAIMVFLKKKHLTKNQARELESLHTTFMTRQENIRFGELAAKFNFVQAHIISHALEKQKESGKTAKLGQLLVSCGAITEKQRDLVLLKQQRDFSIHIKKESARTQPKKRKPKSKAAAPAPAAIPPKLRELDKLQGVSLKISADGLEAFLVKILSADSMPDMGTLGDFLGANGVIFGLIERGDLETFLTKASPRGKPFKIAQGVPMKLPKDGRVEYLFSENFLKAGKFLKNGRVDFKDRGQIPMKGPGDVLARKTPPEEGESGTNVFGDVIEPPQGHDPEFNFGDGTVLSEDGLEILAHVKGFPKKEITGRVSVVQEYEIKGNVDFRTGHVEFDGNVTITGVIKPGFRVTGNVVRAEAVEGGSIVCDGDVIIARGVQKARVFSRGSLSAGYVHHSEVNCMGDVMVEKEILDSRMALYGACLIPNGRILASDIMAKEGIRSGNVGTPSAGPSVLRAGINDYAHKELRRVNALLKERQELLEQKQTEAQGIETELAELDDTRTRIEADKANSLSMIAELEQGDPKEFSPIKLKMLSNHKKYVETLDEKGQEYQRLLDHTGSRKKALEQLISFYTKAISTHIKEVLVLRGMRETGVSKPNIQVLEQVLAGTKLCGPNASTVVRENMTGVTIREVENKPQDDQPPEWVLVVDTL